MSSILTNTSAMVALQTMKSINSGLSQVQSEISTGKSVSSAKDNAAVWAISKTMESDVSSFKGVTDSLAVGKSTVAVARTAAESVTDMLSEMKTKIVAAQGGSDNDRTKLQADIDNLKEQVKSVIGAAQFNGVNLVGDDAGMEVLSSLDRGAGGVSARHIAVAGQNLSTGESVSKKVFNSAVAGATPSAGASADGDAWAQTLGKQDGAGVSLTVSDDDEKPLAAGDTISLRVGDKSVSYTLTEEVAKAENKTDLIAAGLKNAVDSLGIADLRVDVVAKDADAAATLTFKVADTNIDNVKNEATEDDPNDFVAEDATNVALEKDTLISAQFNSVGAGGLSDLSKIEVGNVDEAKIALATIDGLIETATNAAASFGSSEKRLSMQSDFVSKLSDTLKTGIGSMVDANMEEASARLQALQVQQQLGIQSLSIANQAPQSIMSLFR